MRLRLLSFLILQFFAWGLYFYWGDDPGRHQEERSERVFQVYEMPSATLTNSTVPDQKFKLILRDDGIFTRINADRTRENGSWVVNYDIPSLILKSPEGDFKYRILNPRDDNFRIELINAHELQKARNAQEEKDRKLFSSFN